MFGGGRIDRSGFYLEPTVLAFHSAVSRIQASAVSLELGFGEFVNEKLINVAPSGSPPWGPVK